MEKLTYNTNEVAELLGVKGDIVCRMVKQGTIRPLLIQKRPYIFPKSEIERVMHDMVSPDIVKVKGGI